MSTTARRNTIPSHTPGPWKFEIGNQDRGMMSEVYRADDPGFRIGFVTCENRQMQQRQEDIANARLIASAPDLLQALREIMAAKSLDAASQIAFRAINRATGITEE